MKSYALKVMAAVICAYAVISAFPLSAASLELWDIPSLGTHKTELLEEGITHTSFTLTGGKYGMQEINTVEFSLKQSNLYVETLMATESITAVKTVPKMVDDYNKANAAQGKKMVAAVNGALWMTIVDSGPDVATQTLRVPRGVVIKNGEILCSNQMPMEASGVPMFAFGVTDDYIPLIGIPEVDIEIKKGDSIITADGLNRLPEDNALVVYNSRCGISNYALTDALEIVAEYENGEYVHGGKVNAKITAKASGGETRISENTIILCARGDAKERVSTLDVGDSIEISLSITDIFKGESEKWQRVMEAMPGHLPTVINGHPESYDDKTPYPSTIVGYKDNGDIIFLQCDGRQAGRSIGLRFSDMGAITKELGINTAINLDGGGSSTMVCKGLLVNRPSDGSARTVIDGIGVVIGPNRCDQGAFNPDTSVIDPVNVCFNATETLNLFSGMNATSVSLEDSSLKLNVDTKTNDPFTNMSYRGMAYTVSADKYKFIILKLKADKTEMSPLFELFLCTGENTGAIGGHSKTFEYQTDGQWHTYVIDCTGLDFWTGNINAIRFDYGAGACEKDNSVNIEWIRLAVSAENAQKIASGDLESEQSEYTKPDTALRVDEKNGIAVDNASMIISGVKELTTADNLYKHFQTFTKNVNVLETDNGYIGTGTQVQYKVNTYSVVVKGDTTGNGIIGITDYLQIKRHFLNTYKLAGTAFIAADIDGNGEISVTDYAAIKNHLNESAKIG